MSKVVIFEDDLDFADILKECLEEDGGTEVLSVLHNEADARIWIENNDLSRLDCALVDLVLPKYPGMKEACSMTGLRLVKAIRQNQAFTGSILVLTNSTQLEDGERALAAGCDGYLCKHASMGEIPSIVQELKLAIEGDVVIVSRKMRHVFFREELSSKESRLMELLNDGSSWAEVAKELGYKSANAAATIGYRVFAKILDQTEGAANDSGDKRRLRALEKWRMRTGRGEPVG